jgi:predicted metal-binding protein
MPWKLLPSVVIDKMVRRLCCVPYPGHPRGCPNWGKKSGCPPDVGWFDRMYDTSQVYAVWNVFDFGAHVEKMRALHPQWSKRQLECCLYWQGTARKGLHREILAFWGELAFPGLIRTERCPEAMGVNVTETMRAIGVELEWPPVTKAIQVALAAVPFEMPWETR